jgi:ribosomal protein S18 acetylase RimI-like enzyme
MRRDLRMPVPVPVWPEGLRCTALDDAHAPALHALLPNAPTSARRWWRGVLEDVEYDPELCIAVLGEDGTLAAGAVCWSTGFLKDIATAPPHRRRGIGRALLAHLLSSLERRRLPFAELKVERDNPHGAFALYQSMGFVRVDDRP